MGISNATLPARKFKVVDFIAVIQPSDKLRILEDGKEIAAGYLPVLMETHTQEMEEVLNKDIRKFRIHPEMRSKDWKKCGFVPPIHPEVLPDFKYSDLIETIWYEIHV
jgi:hypothetical protein